MNVLVACERSGVIRDAFWDAGHYAVSVDLAPSTSPRLGMHLKADALDIAYDMSLHWDLMIAHPPCSSLANSGARYFAAKRSTGDQQTAIAFFLALAHAPIPKICIENPIGIMSRLYKTPTQIIEPWQYGHPEAKRTCLWLKNLPRLRPTNILEHRPQWSNQTPSGHNKLSPSKDRPIIRATTYKGIAQAMAKQWTDTPE